MIGEIHVIFDLDGTLVDTAPVVEQLLNRMRVERGMAPISRDGLGSLLSIGGVEMIRGALYVDTEEALSELIRFRELYLQTPTKMELVFPGVRKTLKTLSEKGVCLSICTNKPRHLAIKVLDETRLGNYFEYISAGDDLPTKKPNIQNLEACFAKNERFRRRVYVVGDSTVDQALSLNAGVPFFFFSGGYDDGVDLNQVSKQFSCYEQFPMEEIF